MKRINIAIGGHYTAKVSGRIVVVRVDAIREQFYKPGHSRDVFDVTNLKTARKLTFRSAAKFRSAVQAKPTATEEICHHATLNPISGKSEYKCEQPAGHSGPHTTEPISDSFHPEGL